VIVVAMVIMVFLLLQPIATHYCPHHFMVLIIVMVFLVLINVASNYTPHCLHLLQQIVATITLFILMILWAIHHRSFLIVANHYPPSPS
jgi:hypothetical protein